MRILENLGTSERSQNSSKAYFLDVSDQVTGTMKVLSMCHNSRASTPLPGFIAFFLTCYVHKMESAKFTVIGPRDPLIAILSQEAVLPCHMSPRISAANMMVRWFRSDFLSIVHLYLNGKDQYEEQMPEYQGRTELLKAGLTDGNVHLRILNIRRSDEGQYHCFVQDDTDYEEAVLELRVAALGSAPLLSVEGHQDGGIRMVCRSAGWYPEPEVRWKDLSGRHLPSLAEATSQENNGLFETATALIVTKHSNQNLSCCIRNTVLSQEKEAVVHIADSFFPRVNPWMVALSVILVVLLSFIVLAAYLFKTKGNLTEEIGKRDLEIGNRDTEIDKQNKEISKRDKEIVKRDNEIRWRKAVAPIEAMGSDHPLRKLLEEATCPICEEFFNNPVSMDCGHSFCQVCVTEHYNKIQTREEEVLCPQCRNKLKKEKFQTNRQLASMVENIQQLGIKLERLEQQTVDGELKDKLMFCEDDEVIGPFSDTTEEHRFHQLVPMEEAVEEYKAKLRTEIQKLKKAREEILKLQSRENSKSKNRKKRVKCQSEQILSEFEKFHTLLREEEQLLLQRLEEEKRETLQRLQENATKLSQQSSSLQQLITQMEKKCRQPAAELLQDVKGTLSRSEQVRQQEPELNAAELKTVFRLPNMMEILRKFTVDVTLDPDTAHPNLILSAGRKRVCRRELRPALTNRPERFDRCTFALGTERFEGGRRYWEVEVGDKAEWVLGVCKESVNRKGKVKLTPENGYWVMGLKRGEYKALSKSRNILPVSTSPSRVGIFLDYEAGEVSFYNVTDGSHFFTFTNTFSETLRPFFCPGPIDEGTNAAPLTICPVPAQAGGNLRL